MPPWREWRRQCRVPEVAAGPAPYPLHFWRPGAGYRALLDPAVFLVSRGRHNISPPRPVASIDFDGVLKALKCGDTISLTPLGRFPWRFVPVEKRGRPVLARPGAPADLPS
jgi:hypothetical protein